MPDLGGLTSPAVAVRGPAIQPGRRIGKYQILRHMATGGMAEIYLARATSIEQFQKLVVIKRILPAAAGDPAIVAMLIDEARIAATLHHSNIVQVFDMGEADGEYFICMEFLHGRDVHAITRASQKRGVRLAEDHALSIILGVCAGLHYAHEKTDEHGQPLGIVHRDVSPTNVIVTYDGDVKLVDFGLVKAEGRMTESRSGSLKGKLAYMSPEQCRARAVDRRSDIFSLCTMLWELTTGHRLFTGECDYDYLTAILERDPPRPSELIPDYSPVLEAMVMKGLAKDPADRYQTCEELQLDIEEYCRERKLRVSPITLRRMMTELFGEEMQAHAETGGLDVDQLSLANGSMIGSLPPLSAGGEYTSPDVVATRVSRPIEAVAPSSDTKATLPLSAVVERRRSKTALVAAVAVTAVASFGLAYLLLLRGHPGPSAAGEPAAPVAAPEPSTPRAEAVGDQPATAAADTADEAESATPAGSPGAERAGDAAAAKAAGGPDVAEHAGDTEAAKVAEPSEGPRTTDATDAEPDVADRTAPSASKPARRSATKRPAPARKRPSKPAPPRKDLDSLFPE